MLLSVFMIGLVFIAVLAAGVVLVAIAALVELLPSRSAPGPDEGIATNGAIPRLNGFTERQRDCAAK